MSSLRNTKRRRGITLIWVAVTTLALIGVIGLATDAAYVRLTAHQLQIAADASALAAARIVAGDPAGARNIAINVARANTAAKTAVELTDNPQNVASGDIVVGSFNRANSVFTPGIPGDAVKVVARRTSVAHGPLPLIFGPIFGSPTSSMTRTAIAMITAGSNAALLVLNPTAPCALRVHGTNLDLRVTGGPIQVNSSDPCAFCTDGNPNIIAPQIDVTGHACLTNHTTLSGTLYEGAPPIPDPLAGLPAPTWSSDLGTVRLNGTQTQTVAIGPGYYSGGITMTNSHASLTAAPGIYILNGVGLNINGGTFIANGVMFYIIDTTPANGIRSRVDLGGGANINLTPPNPAVHNFVGADTYAGISIFQARDNTNSSTITGGAGMMLGGTLYFPHAHVELTGSSGSLSIQLIADTVEVGGSGALAINYTGAPIVPPKAFLVK